VPDVERAGAVRGEDREPRLILHLLDHVVDLDVRVAVVAVADDRSAPLGGVENAAQVLLGLADVHAHEPREVDPVERSSSLAGGGAA